MSATKFQRLLSGQLHISWHIGALSAGILLGCALVLILPKEVFTDMSWLAIGLSIFAWSAIRRTGLFLVLSVVSGIVIGLWYGSVAQERLGGYLPYIDQPIELTGRVADDTVYGTRGDQQLKLDNIEVADQDLPGKVWVSTSSNLDIKRGDRVRLTGRLDSGFGNMSASMFRAELLDVVRPYPGDIARRARDRFSSVVKQSIPEPQSSLGISYLTGQRRNLPEDLGEQLRMLGLTHIVVASGFHLTVVVRFMRRWVALVSKYLATALSFATIASFLLLTGFSTSMTRASLVAGLSLIAWYYGRHIHPVLLLLVVAATTVIFDPTSLWGDIGWFLSFSAFVGVIILAPLLHDYFWGTEKPPGALRHIVIATTAAQITTFPVVALVFGQYSPLALISNILILPFVPLAMLLTLAAGLGSWIVPALSHILATPAYGLLYYMTETTERLSTLPYASGNIEFTPAALVISYASILLLMIYLWRKTNHDFRRHNPID